LTRYTKKEKAFFTILTGKAPSLPKLAVLPINRDQLGTRRVKIFRLHSERRRGLWALQENQQGESLLVYPILASNMDPITLIGQISFNPLLHTTLFIITQ